MLFFQKQYKIKTTELYDSHFQFIMLMIDLIVDELNPGVKDEMFQKVDMKAALSLCSKIEPGEIDQEFSSKEVLANEDEIIGFLALGNYITGLLNGPHFIVLKKFMPSLPEKDMEELVKKGADRNELTVERYIDAFSHCNKVMARMALIKLRKRENFCRRLRLAMEKEPQQ